jgi:hypothetical protein
MAIFPRHEVTAQFSYLNAALGEAGSGKARYAAAMYFHQLGLLSGTTLEIYRALAKDDASDPLVLLRAAGNSAEIADLILKASPKA